jgi:hypothetical protein
MKLYFKCYKEEIINGRKIYFNVKLSNVSVFSYIDKPQIIRELVNESLDRIISLKKGNFSVNVPENRPIRQVVEMSTREMPNAKDISHGILKTHSIFVK